MILLLRFQEVRQATHVSKIERDIVMSENSAQEMSFEEWMKIGLAKSWCGPPVCYTHDGLPMSEEEEAEFEEGDPCIHVIRMYESEEHRHSIEEVHSPSQWRNHYKDPTIE